MERIVSKIKRVYLNEKPSEDVKESAGFSLPNRGKEKKEYPPKIQMAKNLGGSIKKNISTLLKGDKVAASDKKVKMREKTCLHCDWFDKKKLRCVKCGCVIPIKIRLEEESCPLNKW
tara:strand:- start:435 stop:785 length:351 start_codon:yes stop_codon:yes gene_type:complete